MRTENKTKWSTRQLRALMTEICRASGLDEPSLVIFENSRNVCFHGLASLYSRWIKISIPREPMRWVAGSDGRTHVIPQESLSGKDMADLIVHELRHNTGLRHKDMLDNTGGMDLSKAEGMVIEKAGEKPKPTMEDIKKKRYERTLERIGYNERLVKRAGNRLKKLYKRKRYYEKQTELQ